MLYSTKLCLKTNKCVCLRTRFSHLFLHLNRNSNQHCHYSNSLKNNHKKPKKILKRWWKVIFNVFFFNEGRGSNNVVSPAIYCSNPGSSQNLSQARLLKRNTSLNNLLFFWKFLYWKRLLALWLPLFSCWSILCVTDLWTLFYLYFCNIL